MEILAPCGSPEHLKAAVYAGADAVYLGGRGFSARRNAVNFGAEEIKEAANFCRGFGVKLYVTVNILTRDDEWDALRFYLEELANAAPDALIVQDIGVARFCRSFLPDMPLHASTQLSVHSPEGVQFCSGMGFSRVVIARECDEKTLSEIIEKSDIGIEMFVHGALCVSVSGQCGLSAVIGGRSGNRGLCAQPCRLDFAAGSRRFALSLKDLSLVREIPLLKKMGVSALKIEGRMKRPEYVAAAVRACRAALDGGEPNPGELRAVFSRSGFTQGYFYGKHADMGGVRRLEDVNDTAAVLPHLAELLRAPARRVPVDMDFTMESGRRCVLKITDGHDEAIIHGSVPQAALTRETTADEAVRFLSRLGSTPFIAENIKAHTEPGLALTASQINAMRREACGALLERRVTRLTPIYSTNPVSALEVKPCAAKSVPFLRVHCRTLEQARAVSDRAGQIVLDVETAGAALRGGFSPDRVLVEQDRFIADERKLVTKLARLRKMGARRLLCQNPAHAVMGRNAGFELHGGLGLNVFNSETAAFWSEYGFCDLTASMELRLSECLSLRSGIPVGLTVYGRLPLMLLRRCPFERTCETGGSCPAFLTDRTNRRFPVLCRGGYQELLNADVLWMADKLTETRGAGFLSLLLFDETPSEAAAVLNAYGGGQAVNTQPPKGHTRGLFTRGVE